MSSSVLIINLMLLKRQVLKIVAASTLFICVEQS